MEQVTLTSTDVSIKDWFTELKVNQPVGARFKLKEGKSDLERIDIYEKIKNAVKNNPVVDVIFNDQDLNFTINHIACEYRNIFKKWGMEDIFSRDIEQENNEFNSNEFNNNCETFISEHLVREIETTTMIDAKPIEIVLDLLQKHEGICFGEKHTHISPRMFLIKHMEKLKDAGIKTIYIEGIRFDTCQALLDSNASTDKLPFIVKKDTKKSYDHSGGKSYNLSSNSFAISLLKAAKKAGIRIVGIDSSRTIDLLFKTHQFSMRKNGMLTANDYYIPRLVTMNAVATAIIEQEQQSHPGKYIALMGAAHLSKIDDFKISGVAELLGVPSIAILDSTDTPKREITFNPTSLSYSFNPTSLSYSLTKCNSLKQKTSLSMMFNPDTILQHIFAQKTVEKAKLEIEKGLGNAFAYSYFLAEAEKTDIL
jgi:hypothetical protein